MARKLDRAASTPLYLQISDALAHEVRTGQLAPGGRLPTVRELAAELRVTRPTVHKAFRELASRGLIESTVGRGTFVRRPGAIPDEDAERGPARLTPDRIMSDIQRLNLEQGMLGLAHAEPDPRLAPVEFWDCLTSLRGEAATLLQYVSAQGDAVLREELRRLAGARSIDCTVDDIAVTSGVTQGLSLTALALAAAGDCVAVEEPTYLGLLQVLEAQGLRAVGVPLDGEGPRLAWLERVITRDRPRFFYTIPTFHNPTGYSMSLRRRSQLLALARRHRLTLVEDDIYHRLAYDGPPHPPLKSLDQDGLVVYLDGLSKAILPGIRAGYAILPVGLRERFLSLRRAADLCGTLPVQRALAVFLSRGLLASTLANTVPIYRRRRDALLGALAQHMPEGVTWTEPAGGFCCWLTLPEPDPGLYAAMLGRGLVLAPGEVFLTRESTAAHLRICFGSQSEERLEQAVRLLADILRERKGPETAAAPAADWRPLV